MATESYTTLLSSAIGKLPKSLLQNDPGAVTAKLTFFEEMALHVAASEGHSEFVENALAPMPADAVSETDLLRRTALHHAAFSGSLKAAIALVTKEPTLTWTVDDKGWTPLLHAAVHGYENKDLVWYLSSVTTDEAPGCPFTGDLAGTLVLALAAAGYLDILLYLIQRYSSLATAPTTEGVSILVTLSIAPFLFLSGSNSFHPVTRRYEPPNSVRSIVNDPRQGSQTLTRIMSTSRSEQRELRILSTSGSDEVPGYIRRLQDAKVRHQCAVKLVEHICSELCRKHGSLLCNHFAEHVILCTAASFGITEIVKIFIRVCPSLMWFPLNQDYQHTLLHIAILHRREEIFSLFFKTTARIRASNYGIKAGTLLHLAAKLAPLPQLSCVSGAALQMQRELQWFKAVEKLVQPYLMNSKDDEGLIAQELFTKEHKELAEAGEKWIKDTSNSCMIVSTVIATFVFAAAFTVPGGNDSEGVPIFLWTKSFLVFVISDALALFSSVTSLLMFFSILTARYAEEDCHRLLPKKLIVGLAALFFSIATLMMAFGATLFIVLNRRIKWISIPVTLLAYFPVSIFAMLQFPLFTQMYRSTFENNIFSPQSPW